MKFLSGRRVAWGCLFIMMAPCFSYAQDTTQHLEMFAGTAQSWIPVDTIYDDDTIQTITIGNSTVPPDSTYSLFLYVITNLRDSTILTFTDCGYVTQGQEFTVVSTLDTAAIRGFHVAKDTLVVYAPGRRFQAFTIWNSWVDDMTVWWAGRIGPLVEIRIRLINFPGGPIIGG